MEIAIEIGPQQQIWIIPFWLHIRPSGPIDLWYEIFDHKFHDWTSLLSMVKKYREFLIDDTHRPCSWEECEAPESLPRTLVDTTLPELVRVLPLPLRRIPAASWGDHFELYSIHTAYPSVHPLAMFVLNPTDNLNSFGFTG